jgi:hypothetical protein
MRAAHLKSRVALLSELPPGPRQQVFAGLGPTTIAQIEGAARTAWLPVELDLDITESLARVLGIPATRAASKQGLLRTVEGPLLKPMIQAMIGVLGLTPASWLQWYPRLWPTIYRASGVLVVRHVPPDAVSLHVSGMPRPLASSRAYIEGLAGAFEAAFDVCRVAGNVVGRVDSADPSTAHFDARWTPGR